MEAPKASKRARVCSGSPPDRLSDLPDDVLSSIISLLPVKESIRTSVLSSRWRHLWTISPLSFDDARPDTILEPSFEKFIARSQHIVSHILSSHQGPIHRFRLSKFYESDFYKTADAHIETLIKKGIKELTLHFSSYQQELYTMPSSLAFCKSLSKLSLIDCRFMEPPFPSNCFPNLIDLQIKGIRLSEETVHGLLATFSCLESLELAGQCGAGLINVSSSTLLKLCLNLYGGGDRKIIIQDAPNLKQLMLEDTMKNCESFTVLHAPNLVLLSFVVDNSYSRYQSRHGRISAHCEIVKSIPINTSSRRTFNKILATKIMLDDYAMRKMLPVFLRWFPYLESLEILIGDRCSAHYNIPWEKLAQLNFIEHLKTITIKNIGKYYKCGVDPLAKILILNSTVLKTMTFVYSECLPENWKEKIICELCLDNKASSELEVMFFEESCENSNFNLQKLAGREKI